MDFDAVALQEDNLQEMSRSDKDGDTIMDAIVNQGGLIESILQMLRVVPRRILMVLKLVSHHLSDI